jgi:mevalonate kinase
MSRTESPSTVASPPTGAAPVTGSRSTEAERPWPLLGRGKVILVGEHSVVYGHPAIAASLDRGVRVRVTAAETSLLVIDEWGVSVPADESSGEPLARAFHALIGSRGDDESPAPRPVRPHVRVEAQVELPAGAGLGCSAALGVAIARAVASFDGRELTDEAAAEASLPWERVFHGSPSGVDSAMAARSAVAWFERGKNPGEPSHLERLRLGTVLDLVVADTGEASSTKAVVDGVRRLREAEPARVEKVFGAIDAIVRNAKHALVAGDLPGLGQLMNANHSLLASLLLSTGKLEELVGLARGAGAHGAKLTGAGGGGCMIALAQDEASAEQIRAALAPHAARTFVVRISDAPERTP